MDCWFRTPYLKYIEKYVEKYVLLDFAKHLSFSEVQKKSKLMLRWDFRKKGVCFKSTTKTLYRNKFLVSECIFKLVCRCESCISDIGCALEILLKHLWTDLLLFLILKSNHRSGSLEKGVLKNFAGKHLWWSLFSIKLQAWGCRTQVVSTEICKIFKNTYF